VLGRDDCRPREHVRAISSARPERHASRFCVTEKEFDSGGPSRQTKSPPGPSPNVGVPRNFNHHCLTAGEAGWMDMLAGWLAGWLAR